MPEPRQIDPSSLNPVLVAKLRQLKEHLYPGLPPVLLLIRAVLARLDEQGAIEAQAVAELESRLASLSLLAGRNAKGRQLVARALSLTEDGELLVTPQQAGRMGPLELGQMLLQNLHERLSQHADSYQPRASNPTQTPL